MASVKQKGPMCKLKFISVTRQIACGWLVLVLLTLNTECVNGSRITGTWNTKDFFMFLVKFGFQKTDMHNTRDTSGYIFGNITSKSNLSKPVTFAVLDRGYFLEYYGNRTVVNKEKACRLMFNKISTVAYDSSCNYDGGEIDFLRKVPCPKNQLCPDEDNPWNVVKGHQLTFIIEDVNQPRFWYVSLVACYRNLSTCQWHHMTEEAELEYDLWLVNGNPNISSYNPPVYQFSFDRQGEETNPQELLDREDTSTSTSSQPDVPRSPQNPVIMSPPISGPKRKETELHFLNEEINNLQPVMTNGRSVNSDADEFQQFGNHVAAQLRQLPLQNALKLEEKIQSLLTWERISCITQVSSLHTAIPPSTTEDTSVIHPTSLSTSSTSKSTSETYNVTQEVMIHDINEDECIEFD